MVRKVSCLLLIGLLVVGCGGQQKKGAQGSGETDTLVLISPHNEDIEREFTDAFSEWYKRQTGRDIELQWIDQGGTSDDLRYVESEFERSPDGIGIDLFFGGGTDTCNRMAEKGLLQPYRLPEDQLQQLQPELFGIPLYDAENYLWYGTAISGFGLMYNKELVKRFGLPEIKHWTELAHPKLFGLISAADPRNSGSAHMVYEIILQSYGWEKGFAVLTQMAGNIKTFVAGSNIVTADVRDGKAAYGPAIDFYAYIQIGKLGADKIGYVIPEEARVFTADPIAILKGAPHREAAQMFVRFVLSEAGQKLWMLKAGTPGGPRQRSLYRAAVLPGAYESATENLVIPINPFKLSSTFRYDSKKGGERWNLINELIGKLLIDPHPELVAAWKAILALPEESPKRAEAMDVFVSLPLTEQEAEALNRTRFRDPGVRNTLASEWLNFARKKYQRARQIASQP